MATNWWEYVHHRRNGLRLDITLSGGGSPAAEARTNEYNDGLLVLEKAAERHSLSLIIPNLEFRDGINSLARRDISR